MTTRNFREGDYVRVIGCHMRLDEPRYIWDRRAETKHMIGIVRKVSELTKKTTIVIVGEFTDGGSACSYYPSELKKCSKKKYDLACIVHRLES